MSYLMDIINKRKSIRYFKDTVLSNDILVSLVEAARLAPSACNAQPWRFIIVNEPQLIKLISEKGLGGVVSNTWAASAPVLIIGCACRTLLPYYLGKVVKGLHFHQIDLAIAMEHIVLRATELGLGSCWIGWFNEKNIKGLLGIPHKWMIISLLALGYPRDEKTPPTPRLPLEQILFFNQLK